MYSDSGSDSSETALLKLGSTPYLRFYEKPETELKAHEVLQDSETRRKDRSQLPGQGIHERTPPFHRFFRIRRFFKSYEGFHTGSLDLTGRHMPRFLSLNSRWNSYLIDFLPLTLDAKEVIITPVDQQGNPQLGTPYTDYTFSNPVLWQDFRKKWKIPEAAIFDYSLLLEYTTDVLKTITANPIPCIQKICLIDLPSELLDAIFLHADMYEARLLSFTCRRLNLIGRCYIFGTRTLLFDLPRGFWKEAFDIEDPLRSLDKLAQSERTKTLASTGFLLSHLDLCQEMRTVSMANTWRSSTPENNRVAGIELSQIGGKFFAPIHREFMNILAISSNLVSVTLGSLRFRADDIQCLSNLHSLHTLELQECYIALSARATLSMGNIELPTYNLRLWISPKTVSIWHILPLCSNLRTLSVLSPLEFNISLPSAQIWSRCRFFPHLERICMIHIDSASILSLTNALQSAANTSGLRLTHFKLHTWHRICDADAHILLDSIQGAPIQVLVIEGLAEARPPLFGRIAEIYEQTLVALTLIRRASNRQLRNRMKVVWPHPAWEYAPYLSRLTHLQHFGWNSTCCFTTATTSILHNFERGFPENPSEYIAVDEDGPFGSLGLDALPFAAHCPSLRTFTSDEAFATAVVISRTRSGFISAEPLNHTRRAKEYNVQQWNPFTYFGREWPRIIPNTAVKQPVDDN